MAFLLQIVRNSGGRSPVVANLGLSFSKLNLRGRVGSLLHTKPAVEQTPSVLNLGKRFGLLHTQAAASVLSSGKMLGLIHTQAAGRLYLEDVKRSASMEQKKFYLKDILGQIGWKMTNGIESGSLDPKKMPILDNQAFLPNEPYIIGKYPNYLESVKQFLKDMQEGDWEQMTATERLLFDDFKSYLDKVTNVRHLILLAGHPHFHTPAQELKFIPLALNKFYSIPKNPFSNSKRYFPALLDEHHNSPADIPATIDDPEAKLMKWQIAYKKMVQKNGRKVNIKGFIAQLPSEFQKQLKHGIKHKQDVLHQYQDDNPVDELNFIRNSLKHIHEKFPDEMVVEDMEILKQLKTVTPMFPMEMFQFFWCYDGHARGAIDLNFINNAGWIYRRDDL